MKNIENSGNDYLERWLLEAERRVAEERLRYTLKEGYGEWEAHRRVVRLRRSRWALAAAVFLCMAPTAYVATAAPDGKYMSKCDDRSAALHLADQITSTIA